VVVVDGGLSRHLLGLLGATISGHGRTLIGTAVFCAMILPRARHLISSIVGVDGVAPQCQFNTSVFIARSRISEAELQMPNVLAEKEAGLKAGSLRFLAARPFLFS